MVASCATKVRAKLCFCTCAITCLASWSCVRVRSSGCTRATITKPVLVLKADPKLGAVTLSRDWRSGNVSTVSMMSVK